MIGLADAVLGYSIIALALSVIACETYDAVQSPAGANAISCCSD